MECREHAASTEPNLFASNNGVLQASEVHFTESFSMHYYIQVLLGASPPYPRPGRSGT